MIRTLMRPLRQWVFFVAMFAAITLMPFEAIKHMYAYPDEVAAALLHLVAALALAYLLTCVVHAVGRTWFKCLAYALPTWCVLLRSFLHFALHSELTPKTVMLVAETNAAEVSGFFSTFAVSAGAFKSYALTILYIVVVVFAERHRLTWGRWAQRKLPTKLLAGLILSSFVALGYTYSAIPALLRCQTTADAEWWNIRYYAYSMDDLSIAAYSLYVPHLMKRELQEAVANNLAAAKRASSLANDADSLTLVVVIGESYIKSHAQIYGYPLPTTPRMVAEQKRGNLLAFTDYISPYNFTTEAVKAILSTNDVSAGQNWSQGALWPVVFKRAGYTVEMWSNQLVTADNVFTNYSLNGFIYHPQIRPVAYNSVRGSEGTLDGALVSRALAHAKANSRRHRLLLLHLNGQHFNAKDKYPDTPAFNVFSAADIKSSAPWLTPSKRQQVAEYDNATRYNDHVLGMVFDAMRNTQAVVVYLPDHGEEIYDWRDQYGRSTTPEYTSAYMHSMNDIPLIVWASPSFIARNPQTWHRLQGAVARPGMSDGLCHLLFGIANLRTPYYIARKDMASDMWKPARRIVYGKVEYKP